jgi:hypothetical protein
MPEPLSEVQPVAPREEPRGSRRITCEFCGSSLAANGDFFQLGKRAKELRDASETIEKLNASIAQKEEEISVLKAKIAEREPVSPPPGNETPGLKWPGFKK